MRPCLDDQSLNRLLLLSAPAAFFSYALGHCVLCAGVYIYAEREASSDALCTVASILSTLAGLDKKQGRDDDDLVLFCRAKRGQRCMPICNMSCQSTNRIRAGAPLA